MKKLFSFLLVICSVWSIAAHGKNPNSVKAMAKHILTIDAFEQKYGVSKQINRKNNVYGLSIALNKSDSDLAFIICALAEYTGMFAQTSVTRSENANQEITTSSFTQRIAQLEIKSKTTLTTNTKDFSENLHSEISLSQNGTVICTIKNVNGHCKVQTKLTLAKIKGILNKNNLHYIVHAFAENSKEKRAFVVFRFSPRKQQ